MTDSGASFSERFGYRGPVVEITVREDAPEVVRDGIVMLGYDCGLGPKGMREIVCGAFLKRPDPNNWSDGNVEAEVHRLVDDAPWYKIYDLAERLYREVGQNDFTATRQVQYEQRLNRLFEENGIGWRMENGIVLVRGSEAFELATRDAVATARDAGAPSAANEIHEALKDISRRPDADVTGAIQHAMAALECVARTVDQSTDTLGPIIRRLPIPKPLDNALHGLWGFSSEQGRHVQEGRNPLFEEAELVVTAACAVSTYLLRHRARHLGHS